MYSKVLSIVCFLANKQHNIIHPHCLQTPPSQWCDARTYDTRYTSDSMSPLRYALMSSNIIINLYTYIYGSCPSTWRHDPHVCIQCMYVCMYGCMYVCTVCSYVCTYVRMYLCMYVWMDACLYVCMYRCMHVCLYVLGLLNVNAWCPSSNMWVQLLFHPTFRLIVQNGRNRSLHKLVI